MVVYIDHNWEDRRSSPSCHGGGTEETQQCRIETEEEKVCLAPSVDYLGYHIDAQGTHPTIEAPRPTRIGVLSQPTDILLPVSPKSVNNLGSTVQASLAYCKESVDR